MRFLETLLAVIVITSFSSVVVFADQTELEKRLGELEEQVAILKRQIENNKEDTTAKAKDAPIVTANAKDGFSIKSPDDAFKLKVGGYIQADARIFTENEKDTNATDGLLVRRARPTFSGTVGRDFDFSIQTEFGGSSPSIVDAYGEYKFNPAFKVRGGKFKVPLSLEHLQSTPVTNFAELGLTGNLVPNRDIGFQVSGDVLKERVNYAVGIFNGAYDRESNNSDTNNDKEVVGRVFVQPFKSTAWENLKGLGLGYAASYGHKEGSTIPTYISPGQVSVFSYTGGSGTVTSSGPHVRTSPQVYFYKDNYGVIGEYVSSKQQLTRTGGGNIRDKMDNRAWQVSGTYVLTGELTSYKSGVVPRSDFDFSKGNWGAFELAGRYGVLDIDNKAFDDGFSNLNTSISKAASWATGLNWYLNRNTKVVLDYEQTKFSRGSLNSENRKPESVVTSRLQLNF